MKDTNLPNEDFPFEEGLDDAIDESLETNESGGVETDTYNHLGDPSIDFYSILEKMRERVKNVEAFSKTVPSSMKLTVDFMSADPDVNSNRWIAKKEATLDNSGNVTIRHFNSDDQELENQCFTIDGLDARYLLERITTHFCSRDHHAVLDAVSCSLSLENTEGQTLSFVFSNVFSRCVQCRTIFGEVRRLLHQPDLFVFDGGK